jgi:putative transposase
MARPLRINYSGAFYHITSRGNEQREVFKSQADREKFLCYLESAESRYGAVIHCWCLMGNHYHLLLETPGGNLPQAYLCHTLSGATKAIRRILRDWRREWRGLRGELNREE